MSYTWHGSRMIPQQGRKRKYCTSCQAMIIDIIFDTYSDALQYHPIITKGTTGFVLCGIGDSIAQTRCQIQTDEKARSGGEFGNSLFDGIDLKRLIRFATKGFFGALIWGTWYDISAELVSTEHIRILFADNDWTSNDILINIVRTFSSIIIEQFLACPIIFGLWEIPAATILNNAPLTRIPYEIDDKLGDMLIVNAKVWTAANLIIYNVPVQYRVGLSSIIDIFWQSIVSDFAADCGSDEIECSIDQRPLVQVQKLEDPLLSSKKIP